MLVISDCRVDTCLVNNSTADISLSTLLSELPGNKQCNKVKFQTSFSPGSLYA